MRKKFEKTLEELCTIENLYDAWVHFSGGKTSKNDVAEFAMNISSNLRGLLRDLQNGSYKHGGYQHFVVADPKRRDIHKASVRDRVVHQFIYDALYTYFDQRFIFDSYSCRVNKGAHRAIDRFDSFARSASQNHKKTVWVLKCDIKKCFASVDHTILKGMLARHVVCPKLYGIICTVIDSYKAGNSSGVGIPLGNLTSQLFVNIYMNALDQWMKREAKQPWYIRYADDFVVLSCDKSSLVALLSKLKDFLGKDLKLEMHPDKISIKTYASGVDFLGYVHFTDHRVLRVRTKRKMLRIFSEKNQSSYLGILSHCNGKKVQAKLPELC
jgi:RNA-directed DNA polymerase